MSPLPKLGGGLRKFRPFPAYKESGVDWLGSIPESWAVKRLRFLGEINPSSSELLGRPSDLEVSFVPMEAVGEYGGIDLTRTKLLDDVKAGYTYFRDGDAVVAKITPCFENGKGALAYGLTNGTAFGTTELHVIRHGNLIDARFLFYVTLSDAFRRLGEAEMYGAGGQKRVPESFVEDFPFPVITLEEQRAIANFLDRETAKIDSLVAKNERLIELLQEKRSALITRAVTKGLDPKVPVKDPGIEWLGEIPVHWKVLRLAMAVQKITNGFVGPTRDILVNEGTRYLQSLHIKGGAIDFDRKPYYVTERWSRVHAKSILREGDVLVVQTGDIGQVCAVPKDFDGSNCHALIILRLKAGLGLGSFLSLALQSDYGQNRLWWSQTGALHPHLECGHVREIAIALSPPSEQQAILEHLQHRTSELDALISRVGAAIDHLRELRIALISAAVTGQIDVREEAA